MGRTGSNTVGKSKTSSIHGSNENRIIGRTGSNRVEPWVERGRTRSKRVRLGQFMGRTRIEA